MRALGLLLNLLGVVALWSGGIPYKQRETVINIGPLQASTEVDKKLEIPPPVGAGLVGLGTALLWVAASRGRAAKAR